MLHLEIKFYRLQKNALERHHFLLRIVAERFECIFGQLRSGRLDDVHAFLGRFFDFAGQEQTAASRHIAWERSERMEHIKSVKVHDASGDCVVSEAHRSTTLHDESGAFLAVSTFGIVFDPITNGKRIPQVFLLIIPARHFAQSRVFPNASEARHQLRHIVSTPLKYIRCEIVPIIFTPEKLVRWDRATIYNKQ